MSDKLRLLEEKYREASNESAKNKNDKTKRAYALGLLDALSLFRESGGYVEYDRNTPEGRRAEIDKWVNDPWYPVILRLDFDLARIDPGYNLTQLKTKFGELRYYAHPNRDEVGMEEFQELIRKAERECEELR